MGPDSILPVPSQAPLTPSQRISVLAAAVICGGAVMEVEILGARVVGPWYGVSLFVWTALITVALLSLAAGYFLGGRIADRRGSVRVLGFLVGLAGLFLLAVPLLRVPVLKATVGLGVRSGALLAAVLLFGPALTLLGMVSPLALKLFLRDVHMTGRTVGRLSALSTLGSFAGTIATGFWLIPLFHVDQIASGSAMLLLGLSGVLLATSTRQPAALLLPLLAIPWLGTPPLPTTMLPSGTRAQMIRRQGSFYGQISVVDYTFYPRHTREMLVDGIIQGGIDMHTLDSIYPFTYSLEQAALTYNPAAGRALIVGLGPGTLPRRLGLYGITGTVVDIDPMVIRIAEEDFGFREGTFRVVVADGRQYLEASVHKYDIVALDAFSAENEPAHLLTVEAFRAVDRVLNPGGVMVINLSGLYPAPGADNRVLNSVIASLCAVFPQVRTHYVPSGLAGHTVGFTIAARKAGGPTGISPPPFLPVHPMAAPSLDGLWETIYAATDAPPYSDGWVPVEAHGAQAKLQWRRDEIEATPPEMLLD